MKTKWVVNNNRPESRLDFAVAAPSEIVSELGARLAEIRLSRNLSQQEVADRIGVHRNTVSRIERGETIDLTVFVGYLQALGLADGLDVLIQAPLASPSVIEKLSKMRRERASGSRKKARPARGKVVWPEDEG